MKITGEDKHKIILKERTYEVIKVSFMFFAFGLALTLNSAGGMGVPNKWLFAIGPIVMVLSFLYAIYSFKIVTTTIDRYGHKIIRIIRKATSSYTEKIGIEDISELVVLQMEKGNLILFKKEKYNVLITWSDGSAVVLNESPMRKKKAFKLGYEIAKFLDVPIITK